MMLLVFLQFQHNTECKVHFSNIWSESHTTSISLCGFLLYFQFCYSNDKRNCLIIIFSKNRAERESSKNWTTYLKIYSIHWIKEQLITHSIVNILIKTKIIERNWKWLPNPLHVVFIFRNLISVMQKCQR